MASRGLAYGVLPGALGENKTKKTRKAQNTHVLPQAGLSVTAVLGQELNSRGMQEPQGILVVHVWPLLQESIDVGQASPLPAGRTGEHQGE